MTAAPHAPDPAEAAPRDPWDRFGWVMGVIWLVFLGFPLAATVVEDRPWAVRAAAIGLILVFAAVYVHGFVRLSRTETWSEVVSWGWRYVAVLAVIMGAATALVGFDTLGMAPFVVAMGMFVLPLRASLVVFAAAVVGVVGVAWSLGRPFTSDGGAWYLVVIVVLVGVVTAVVRVLDQLGAQHRALADNLAVTAERERVARDVHDVLGHSLTVVTVKAELASRLVDTDPERAKAELVEIHDLTRQSLAEIRATVGGLRVARLVEQIDAARVALVGAGIVADLPGDVSVVEPRHRVVLAWALREAVTNVVRHSGAARCRVELGTDWLSVVDDGKGMRGRREGNGLRGLRERVHAAGGAVELASGPDGVGTSLRVQL